MAVDHSAMRLGLRPPRLGLVVPGMARMGVALPQAAPECHWGRAVAPEAWGMDLNDQLGDCTIAAVDHARRLMRTNAGLTWRPAVDAELVDAYTRVSGYNPAVPGSDRGAVWSDVLAAWTREGFLMGGARDLAAAFVRVAAANDNELRLAIQWFGCAMVGLAMPLAAQSQDVWAPVPGSAGEPGSWGGHAVVLTGYDPDGLDCITWGAPKRLTWPFWRACATEAWAVLSADWIEWSGASPAGIALDALKDDLAEMAA